MPRLVQKHYFEDIDENVGYAYRYWDLTVDVDGRRFDVRIYRDEPETAYVAFSPRPVDDAQHAALRALARHLEEAEGAKLHVIGDSGGYEELEGAIERKLARESTTR
ncbi:MAG TPA: hypothetical protein VG144_14010 [Gaiellaceae bacterium]|nr:hypothetical protein [Gaiellaceae bacterium]